MGDYEIFTFPILLSLDTLVVYELSVENESRMRTPRRAITDLTVI
jgi:hypothetical protein